MGAMVLGALSANYVSISTPLVFKSGEVKLEIQSRVLDQLFLGLLPLAVTLGTLYLLKNKKYKATTVMLILVIVGAIGGVLGIL